MRRISFVVAIVVLAGAVFAQNVNYRQDPGWQAPEEAAARQNPLPASEEIVGGGRKLFLRNCAECHGSDGRGLKNAADLQLIVVQEQSDGVLFWKMSNGNPRRGMPSFSSLPESQRWQLVLYLRTLAKRE